MAAYASVVSLAQTIQQFLHHEYDHHRRPTTLVGDLQIKSLQKHVNFLQAFLDDSHDDKVTTDLEDRIRDASNVAEDMIEYFMSGSEDLQNLSSKLRKAAKRIRAIVGEVTDIKNNTARVEFANSSSSRLPPTIGTDEIMVGFDDDLLAIMSRLRGNSSRLQIIPICGMGGIGKTTLARHAYEDQSTAQHFHIRAWVTVSQDYKAQDVLSRLQVSMKVFIEERKGLVDEVVYKSLKGNRYLIVLDDVWSAEVWDDVKRLFPDDNNGSRILLTTRLAEVVAYADSSRNLHQMRLMGEDWSWQLLQQKVFKEGHCPPQLGFIGMEIARRCKGLPLAIVVVAGILSTIRPTKASWEEVASKVTATLNANENEITKIFSLSYTNLPHHLRPCFLYMGHFPEDYEIYVSKLAKLWTAEGFMKPSRSKCFEDVAEEYLEDLVRRSLVLVMRRKSNGRIKSCIIHDLLRDLCIRKAEEENFLLLDDKNFKRANVDHRRNLHQRRVSKVVHAFDLFNMDPTELYDPIVHSLLFFYNYGKFCSLKKFRLLRVLDATKTKLTQFLEDILELYLLRYLAFFLYTVTFDVPPPISKLQNFETLILFPYHGSSWKFNLRKISVRFPSEIWRMRRHLHVAGILEVPLPEPYPTTTFAPQDLQTLATVKNFKCTERVLQMIQNLKKLGILYVVRHGLINLAEEYHLHNLVHLRHLEKLSIRVEKFSVRDVYGFPASASATELRFPTMLKKLKLHGFQLSEQVMGMIGSFPNLEMLKLIDCNFEDHAWKTTEGQFHKLKFLEFMNTDLQEWITEERSHFPSLKHLHLRNCKYLREIPEEIGGIPTLELIEVDGFACRSLVKSAKRIKEEQESYGNDSFQVRFKVKIR